MNGAQMTNNREILKNANEDHITKEKVEEKNDGKIKDDTKEKDKEKVYDTNDMVRKNRI